MGRRSGGVLNPAPSDRPVSASTCPARWAPVASPNDPDTLPLEEHLLVRAAQEGDRRAFAALVERYWDRLYRWLYHLTHDCHAAEDLTQETFLKAFAALDSFRAGTNFRAWLFRIGHNSFANQRRVAPRARPPIPEHLPAARALARGRRGAGRAGAQPRGAAAAGPGGRPAARRIPGRLPPAGRGGPVVPADRPGARHHGGDGPLARLQGPAETDDRDGPAT